MMGTAVLMFQTGGSQLAGSNRGHKHIFLTNEKFHNSQNTKWKEMKQLDFTKLLIITQFILEAKQERSKE